jgi:multimeric flavodoxin WrbA
MEEAVRQGAEVSSFTLNDLKYIGCQGCYGCKRRSDVCVINDDLTPVLNSIINCDALLITSPIYIYDVTGQTKCFIDRTFSYLTPDFQVPGANPSRLTPGKKLLFLITQGDPDPNAFSDVPVRYEKFFQGIGFSTQSMVVSGVGLQEKVTESRPEVIKRLRDLARQMLKP